MQKKLEGGFKPLWVKCGCGKWNGVQVGAVLKYLEKIVTPAAVHPPKPKAEEAGGRGDE